MSQQPRNPDMFGNNMQPQGQQQRPGMQPQQQQQPQHMYQQQQQQQRMPMFNQQQQYHGHGGLRPPKNVIMGVRSPMHQQQQHQQLQMNQGQSNPGMGGPMQPQIRPQMQSPVKSSIQTGMGGRVGPSSASEDVGTTSTSETKADTTTLTTATTVSGSGTLPQAGVATMSTPTSSTGPSTPSTQERITPTPSTSIPASTSTAVATTSGSSMKEGKSGGSSSTSTSKDVNAATVCKFGQETVQEIVGRTQEVFSYLKVLHPPVGAPSQDQASTEKQQRIREVLNGITMLFKRLNLCWETTLEQTSGFDSLDIESLIPFKDFDASGGNHLRNELEKKRGEAYRTAMEEYTVYAQQLTLKNRQLKEIIDQMRYIIWEINTMLAMRQ